MSTAKFVHIFDIHKSYGDNHVLKGINLNIEPNDIICILGLSGSGKTTLLNVLSGLLKPDQGDILIQDTSLYQKDSENLRIQKIGLIFQKFELLDHFNIIDNVKTAKILFDPDEKSAEAKAMEILKKVGLGDHLYKFPNQLSSGQKQRVGIARALINNPNIILADEPTGSLDTVTSEIIMDLLKSSLNEETSLIFSTHNLEIAEHAKKIYVLKNGTLNEVSKELLKSTTRLKDLYN